MIHGIDVATPYMHNVKTAGIYVSEPLHLDRVGRNAVDVLPLIDLLHGKVISARTFNLGTDYSKTSGKAVPVPASWLCGVWE